MTQLAWDASGTRLFETGVDRGVLYIPDNTGAYTNGYAWNGLTTVTETPAGAEASAQYADNIKYLNLISTETFGGTIEAFTYPDAFAQCDGTAALATGVTAGQQGRVTFGLSYRTRLGNDLLSSDFAYKIHLIYSALAAPSERAYATINDSPDALKFSWGISTTPITVPGFKPTSLVVIDSSKVDPIKLAAFEAKLYGKTGTGTANAPYMPLPTEVISSFT